MTDNNPPIGGGGIAVVVEVTLPSPGGTGDTRVRTSINAGNPTSITASGSGGGGGGNMSSDKAPPLPPYDPRKSMARAASASVSDPMSPSMHATLPPPSPLPPPIHHTELAAAGGVTTRSTAPSFSILPPPSPLLPESIHPSPKSPLLSDSKNETPAPVFATLVHGSPPHHSSMDSKQHQHHHHTASPSTPAPRRTLRPSPEEELKSGPGPSSPVPMQPIEREGIPLLRIDTDDPSHATSSMKQAPSTPSANGREWEPTTPSNANHHDDTDDEDEHHVPLPRPSFSMDPLVQNHAIPLSHHSSLAGTTTAVAGARLSFDDGTESISMGIPPTPTAKRPRFAEDDDSTIVQPANRSLRDEDDDQPNNAPPG
jgi:hypothetical protein